MASDREIKYLGRDYNSSKQQLIEFVKLYFPDSWQDFSENSAGMALLEQTAYISDILNFYLDNSFNELFSWNRFAWTNRNAHSIELYQATITEFFKG